MVTDPCVKTEYPEDARRQPGTVEQRVLARSLYDTASGKRLALEARHLGGGRLAEAVFRERSHRAVLPVFGVNDRPMAPEDDDE